jgi:RNA polymerase sigma factor (TIGR02999 family)
MSSLGKTQWNGQTRHRFENIFFPCPRLTQPSARVRAASWLADLHTLHISPPFVCMSDITVLLRAAGQGDAAAADQVVALLYADLQRMARSRMQQSGHLTLLDATGLVHESYLRLFARLQQAQGGPQQQQQDFPDRKHFLAYASRVMHTIVIDMVRSRQAARHGGEFDHVTLNTAVAELPPQGDDEILRVHEALAELAAMDPRLAQVVEMRYFGGLLEAEIAETLGVTERTVQRDWQKARLFLSMALKA